MLPKAGSPTDAHICGRILKNSPAALVEELEVYREGEGATWAAGISEPPVAEPDDAGAFEQRILDSWRSSVAEASRPRFRPVNVTGEALAANSEERSTLDRGKKSRFGTVFGETVHRAIGIVLRHRAVAPSEGVRRAAVLTGLDQHLTDAAADVERAIDGLKREGLLDGPGRALRLEYPVAAPVEGGKLIVGYVDLVSLAADRLDVVDFKTDEPPLAGESVDEEYLAQVRQYARLLDSSTSAVSGRFDGACYSRPTATFTG